jgi:CRISPR system Cascade subunit CasC
MTTPRFVQISALAHYPASLLNRDDAGLAKRIPVGGVLRTRISSQCLKAHWRKADVPYALDRIDPSISRSIRDRLVWQEEIANPLFAEGFDRDAVTAALREVQKLFYAEREGRGAGRRPAGDDTGLGRSEIVVLGRPEIEYLKDWTRRIVQEAGGDAKDAAAFAQKRWKEERDNFHAMRVERKAAAGIDAAMFGRFVSGDRRARVDAAVHVAHAFTTHAEQTETDWFTAVGDIEKEGQGAGAEHLNASELTSGLYYVYVVVDVPLLVSNIEGCERARWREADRKLAARAVGHLLRLIATVSPGAKLGSTAPYDHAGFVLVEAGELQPRTLANAFLRPVSPHEADGDLYRASVDRLADYVAEMDAMYGLDAGSLWRRHASRFPVQIRGSEKTNFEELVAAAEELVREG